MAPILYRTVIATLWVVAIPGAALGGENLRGCLARLHHENPAVRRAAAFALGAQGIDAASAIPHLRAVLPDSDPSVRKWAAWAIDQIECELKPRPPAIALTVKGDYIADSGEQVVQIDPKGEHSGLSVSGDVSLGGKLSVSLDRYAPRAGEKREIISNAARISGRYTELQFPELPKGLRWILVYDDLANGKDLDGDGLYDVTLTVESSTSD